MAHPTNSTPKRLRVNVELDQSIHRRLRRAAAERDLTMRQYVVEAIEDRLRHDVDVDAFAAPVLSAATDPVLAELWDNPEDAAYDRL